MGGRPGPRDAPGEDPRAGGHPLRRGPPQRHPAPDAQCRPLSRGRISPSAAPAVTDSLAGLSHTCPQAPSAEGTRCLGGRGAPEEEGTLPFPHHAARTSAPILRGNPGARELTHHQAARVPGLPTGHARRSCSCRAPALPAATLVRDLRTDEQVGMGAAEAGPQDVQNTPRFTGKGQASAEATGAGRPHP